MAKCSMWIFLGLIFLFMQPKTEAQSLALRPEQGYVKSYFTDTKNIVLQPLYWQKRAWIVAGGSAVVFTTLYFGDLKIQEFSQQIRSPQTDWVSQYVAAPIGNGLVTLPALGLLYGSGWVFNNPKSRHVALQATKAFVLSAGAAVILKQIAHRQRPDEGISANPRVWFGPYAITSKNTSFYSGSTTRAFAIATVFAQNYDGRWVAPLSYGLATLTGLSRINDNKHWVSDVFVGALMGYWIGRSVSKMHPNLNWSVNVGHQNYSLSLAWQM